MPTRSWLLAFALVGAASCGLFDEPQTDGEVCRDDDECSTGVCTAANLCSHSACECPSGNCALGGEQSSDCRDGWVCVGYDSVWDPLKEFFGGEPNKGDGYCEPSCTAGCPEHYTCDGDLCTPNLAWATPEPTIVWSGAVSGELSGRDQMTTVIVEEGSTITLTGSASSPIGSAIASLTWMTTLPSTGEYMTFEQPTIEITLPEGAGNYLRAELDVIDDHSRNAHISVTFESCAGPGQMCGWQGNGCCNGCDTGSNTCM